MFIVLTVFYSQTSEPFNADVMAREFSMQFAGRAFTQGELLAFRFVDDKKRTHILSLRVLSIIG